MPIKWTYKNTPVDEEEEKRQKVSPKVEKQIKNWGGMSSEELEKKHPGIVDNLKLLFRTLEKTGKPNKEE